ncbi:MAG: carboxypeptidase regulatory-like domain-containing protein [Eubacterium sp.]|nr:carboxypeptidase regulatory-like domain-containing protein [Eubacterium sp.]
MMENVKVVSKKLISLVMAMILMLSVLPIHTSSVVYAEGETVASYVVTVLDKEENPIENASVELNGTTEKTDTAGEVAFTDVPIGDYTLTVNKDGYADGSKNLVIGEESTGTEIHLDRIVTVSGTISGVAEADKNAVTVTAECDGEETAVTVKDLSYSFDGVEGKNYTVSATAKNYAPASVTVTAGDETAETALVLALKVQTIVVTIENDGTVTIDGEQPSEDNTVDVTIDDEKDTAAINVRASPLSKKMLTKMIRIAHCLRRSTAILSILKRQRCF